MSYAEIHNETVINIYSELPKVYKNISNFFALSTDKLVDLSWSGNNGYKFYTYIENRPESPTSGNYVLVGPTYSIDHANKQVIGTFMVQEVEPPPPEIPESISARQIRLWLIENNISLTGVEAIIDSIVDEKLREKTKVEWEYAPYVERHHPLIDSLGQALGLNSQQIDAAFIEASLL